MPLPDDEQFEEFLSNTLVVAGLPSGPAVVLSESPAGSEGSPSGLPSLYLQYPKTDLKLASVLGAIRKEQGPTPSRESGYSSVGPGLDRRDQGSDPIRCRPQRTSAFLQ